jgi:hypothetical protein
MRPNHRNGHEKLSPAFVLPHFRPTMPPASHDDPRTVQEVSDVQWEWLRPCFSRHEAALSRNRSFSRIARSIICEQSSGSSRDAIPVMTRRSLLFTEYILAQSCARARRKDTQPTTVLPRGALVNFNMWIAWSRGRESNPRPDDYES